MSGSRQSLILTAWLERFAGLLQNAAGATPEIEQTGSREAPAGDATYRWRSYTSSTPKGKVWIGAAQSCRQALAEIAAGSADAAGESAAPEDACWRLLDDSLDSPGVTAEPPPSMQFDAVVIHFPVDEPLELLLGFDDRAPVGLQPAASSQSAVRDILLSIDLPLTVRFGRMQTPLEALIGLNTGSLIHFDRTLDQPVEVLVNGRVVARGETVTVQGNYGVRILEVASRRDLLDTTASVESTPPPDRNVT